MNNTILLECAKLGKQFNDGGSLRTVLNDINLQIAQGQSIAIVGPSGSGKSTLLHLLGGLDMPTTGEVKIKGQRLSDLNEKQKCLLRNKFLGFVYQYHHLLKDFTVIENVIMPLLIAGESGKMAREKAKHLLKLVQLDRCFEQKINQLSGGERQRVAVVRAIINNPHCILADEPTGNLDQKTAASVYDTLIYLKKEFNSSLVIVTHDVLLAELMDITYHLSDCSLKLMKS